MNAKIIMTLRNVEFVEKNTVCMALKGCNDVVKCYAIYLEEEDRKKLGFLTYEVVKEMGLSLEELDKIAIKNTLSNGDAVLYNVQEYLIKVLSGSTAKNFFEIEDDDYTINWSHGEMYTLTNEQAFQGAALIAIPKIREKLLNLFKENLIIIPSSVHEIIIIPQRIHSTEGLEEHIKDVNSNFVSEGDVLSDKPFILEYK